MIRRPPRSTLFPDPTLFGSGLTVATAESCTGGLLAARLTERPGSSAYVLGGVTAYANSAKEQLLDVPAHGDRKSTRLNSSHANISYAVFCLKKKKNKHST